ncbi:alpha/beta hydrolase-fold protein [Flavobacterium aurantiibacter]|uniref:Alpha/beta hydrolase n=1 Tax=Flavobacterium aurantiibacter TaxID=2023067 RepID=A0A255ZGM7_9FLAO|nr:alpha/beta hydrolase-fold protein [Flavobacterium aurantiibacter]OYQ40589.1 hypothetical protein CHX27_13510 [Flavobacterium aurantiibacter]
MKNFCLLASIAVLVLACKANTELLQEHSLVAVDSIYSKNLNEYRKHNVYLPRGFKTTHRYPIIFATDGGTDISETKELLDSLISKQIIKPLIFIASFSNTKIADSSLVTTSDGKKFI